jgi:uncharacterized membrane protein
MIADPSTQLAPLPNSRIHRLQMLAYGELLPVVTGAGAAGLWMRFAFFHGLRSFPAVVAVLSTVSVFVCCFLLVAALASFRVKGAKETAQLRQQIGRCSLVGVALALFIPEYLGRLQPPLLRSVLLLSIFALLWLALCGLCIAAAQSKEWSEAIIWRYSMAGLVLLFAAMTWLAIRKYLVFGYVGQDLAYFGQIMYTTLHGHLFWGNLLQDLLYSKPITTDFAGHNSPAMFFLVPIYGLFPHPITLLVVRNLALFACAVPVYLIARRHVPVLAACLWAFALLVTPAVLYQSTFDFYPLTFAALPLLFAVYFYTEYRYTAFCFSLALTLLVREDLVFFVFGMGLVALLQRRNARWFLAPTLAAVVWAVVSFLIVIPAALHGASFVTDACFAHLGATRSDMVQNTLMHPRSTLLLHGNLVYLKTLLTSTGLILSVSSLVSFLSLPYLAINLLAGGGPCITTVISAQYSVVPAVLIFIGTLLTALRRSRRNTIARIGSLGLTHSAAAPLLLVALGLGILLFATGDVQANELRSHMWDSEARNVLSLIPAGAAVAAPRYMLPHLANRNCLYQTHRLANYHHPLYEYLILDTDWNHIDAAPSYEAQYQQLLRDSAVNPELQSIYSSPQFRVYRNLALQGRSCASNLGADNSDSGS